MARTKKPTNTSNLTIKILEPKDQKGGEGDNSYYHVIVARVFWKGLPFLRVLRDDTLYQVPDNKRFFIQSLQENYLKLYHGEQASMEDSLATCELIAKGFEEFLNKWHNSPKSKKEVS